jgi:hypothetical protein
VRHYRRNADEGLRRLERSAAAGDHEAKEALLQRRVRAGYFDQAAHALISESDGRLPSQVVHRLHDELMKYDLMEKLPVWIVVSTTGQASRSIYGTRDRAVAGAAELAANAAANYQLYALAERLETLVQQGYTHLNEGAESRAVLAFTEAVHLFNDEVSNAQIVVRRALIE